MFLWSFKDLEILNMAGSLRTLPQQWHRPFCSTHIHTMICRVYIYITNQNYKKCYEIGISLEYNVRFHTPHHSLGPPLPPKCSCSEAQTARMAMSISETLQRLQATKVSNRSGGATGSKGPKTADLEVRHYVPRLEKIPLEWHFLASFSFLDVLFFFWGGGFSLNEWWWHKIMEHKFRWSQAD